MPNYIIDMQATGQHLKNLATKYGYTREILADALDVTPNAITHYYSGRYLPPTRKLPLLSNLFMLPIEKLFILEETNALLHTELSLYTLQNLGAIYDDLDPYIRKDITKRIMDALFSGYSTNSHYIQNQINYAFSSLKFNNTSTN